MANDTPEYIITTHGYPTAKYTDPARLLPATCPPRPAPAISGTLPAQASQTSSTCRPVVRSYYCRTIQG